ncbi:hypothetical protein SLS62_004142 [Diatrype stigma]|uniref:Aminoglycoside phosphotransferase domain-containing protein n=1 Tax=Diatrype stigma TaxID=117547 RepID=A0AAN9UUZ9_9PEZI
MRLDIKGRFPLLGDHSRSNIEKVDARFLGTHARLSPSIHWIGLSREYALNESSQVYSTSIRSNGPAYSMLQPARRVFSSLKEILTRTCIAIWVKFPRRVRVGTYKLLRMIGCRIYGSHPMNPTQRLPFGLYLKNRRDFDLFHNEFNAMKMVRQYTTVPAPRPIDVVRGETDENAYLLMSRVPGVPFALCDDMLSDRDLTGFRSQMQDLVSQLRAIPKLGSPEFAICNTLGGACRDTRVQFGDPIGPFVDEAAFSQLLRNPDEPSRRGHSILFTHADLNARNILVDRVTQSDGTKVWEVTGIVDWEFAGYYPEYWEYTKSLFEGFRYSERIRDMLHELFRGLGDYSKEFEVENRSWEQGDYV